jgi:hypothetical protein
VISFTHITRKMEPKKDICIIVAWQHLQSNLLEQCQHKNTAFIL